MDDTQIKFRDKIIEALWAVEDNAISPEGPEVIAAAQIAVRNLEELIAGLKGDHDAANLSKTWRYLGDACFSLSGKKNEEALQRGREAYLRAEALLAENDDILEMAKLQFNLANTTRLIGGGRNRSLLEEARRRYYKARELFKLSMPGAVSQVEDAIQCLEIVLRGSDLYETAERGFRQTKQMQERLLAAGDDPQKVLQVQQEFNAFNEKEPSPFDLMQNLSGFLDGAETLLPSGSSSSKNWLSGLQSQLEEMKDPVKVPELERQADENALFDMVIAAIRNASQNGEINDLRENNLRTVLKEFGDIYNRPAKTPEQMALKSRDLRELIERYKSIFLNPQLGQGIGG